MTTAIRNPKRSFRNVKNWFHDQLWNEESFEVSRLRRVLRSLLKISLTTAQDFIGNLITLRAMALAFKTLLSLAPLLAVIFSILKGLGVHNRMQPALAEALAPLGEKAQEVTSQLIGFVDRMSAGTLGSVGMATLFVTVLSLMGTIEEAFNHIWRVKSPRNLARKFSDYLSVLLVGPVLIVAALTITATLQSNTFVQKLMSFEPFGTLILTFLRLVPYLTLWGAFSFIYIFIPNTRVKLQSALVGGLAAAILWQTVGWGFTVFVASSTRYYAIYSSFAVLLLFLLWLQVGWVIILLGTQVAYAHQHVDFFEGEREALAFTTAGRERLALEIMFLIGRNFYAGADPMNVSQLAAELRVPEGSVKDFMEIFEQSQFVLPLADQKTFVLRRNPETIDVKEILDCVKNSGQKSKKQLATRTRDANQIEEVLADIDHSVAEALKDKNLHTLVEKHSSSAKRKAP